MSPASRAAGDGNEPDNDSSTSEDEDDDMPSLTTDELVTTANELVTSTAMEQVTTADGLVTATTFPDAVPNPEDETQDMYTAPNWGHHRSFQMAVFLLVPWAADQLPPLTARMHRVCSNLSRSARTTWEDRREAPRAHPSSISTPTRRLV